MCPIDVGTRVNTQQKSVCAIEFLLGLLEEKQINIRMVNDAKFACPHGTEFHAQPLRVSLAE